jgi:hypothetical protein
MWGALGALSLGALLLPVNATWAQKPEEKKEIRVIVTTDDDAAKVSKPAGEIEVTDVFVNSPNELVFVADPTKPGKDGEKPNIMVVLKTDDSSVSVAADSVEDAIKKITEQIQTLGKGSLGDKEKAQQEALMQIAKQLKQIATANKGPQSGDGTSEHQLLIRRHQDQAKIDKARARIKELSTALAAAKLDLAKLEGHGANSSVMLFATPGHENHGEVHYKVIKPKIANENLNVVIRKKVKEEIAAAAAATAASDSAETVFRKLIEPKVTGKIVVDPKSAVKVRALTLGIGEEDRIQALEKKLNKLLEEVASLKKKQGN